MVDKDKPNMVSLYGKLGWDSQINQDLRVRITGSGLVSPGYNNGGYLYSGDRAGARYYSVMSVEGASPTSDFRTGRFNPAFKKFTSFQVNPFVKYKGLEFFGIYEMTMGDQADSDDAVDGQKTMKGGSFTQIGAEALYRFGSWDQFYVGGRYNSVFGKASEAASDINISRINAGFGWFMTKNVMAKMEYVNQTYGGDGHMATKYQGGKFDGIVFEAVIAF
jgi:hypothetical protein